MLRQGYRIARQLGRAQPATLRVVNAAKTTVDTAQGAERGAIGRHGQLLWPFNCQHVGNLPGTFFIIGQLADATPLVVKRHALF
ncbi:hypothetical protein D3C81_1286630 [compost metagenome]